LQLAALIKSRTSIFNGDIMKQTKIILDHYGISRQIDKALEELAELTLTLHHYKDNKATADEVIDELADVLNMALQLKHWFGDDEVAKRFQYKIERQLERIGSYGYQETKTR